MNMKKSIALMLALVLVLCLLAGCATADKESTQGSTQATIPSSEPEKTEPEETEPEETDPILKEYLWDVTVIYENGACGAYTFINAGLEDWADQFDPKYMGQTFQVTPDNNTFTMPIMDHSNWIVDNTRDWYKWVIIDENDEGGQITFTVVKGLQVENYADHGVLEIHIALS